MTDRYQPAWESEDLAEVLYILFQDSSTVSEIQKELDQAKSTISTKLKALKRDNLVEKDNWVYTLKKDVICDKFASYLAGNISEDKFRDHKEKIFSNDRIRQHLLGFVETELNFDELPLNEIFRKYRDNLMIRYDYIYKLARTPEEDIPEEKKEFWHYLTVIQGLLCHSAWTEPLHGTALESRIFPGEEYKMPSLEKEWQKVGKKAKMILKQIERRDSDFNFEKEEGPSKVYKKILDVSTDLEETYLVEPIWAVFTKYGLIGDKTITKSKLKELLMETSDLNRYSEQKDLEKGINKLLKSDLISERKYGDEDQKKKYKVTAKAYHLLDLIERRERLRENISERNVYTHEEPQIMKHHSLKLNIINLISLYKGVYLCPHKLAKIFDRDLSEILASLEDIKSNKAIVSKQVPNCDSAPEDEKHEHFRYNLERAAYTDMVIDKIWLNKELTKDLDPKWSDYSPNDYEIPKRASEYKDKLTKESTKTAEEFAFSHKVKYSCPECDNSWVDLDFLKEIKRTNLPENLDKKIASFFSLSHLIKGLKFNKRFEKDEENNNESEMMEDGLYYFLCPVCAEKEGKKVKLKSQVINESHSQQELNELYEYLIKETPHLEDDSNKNKELD